MSVEVSHFSIQITLYLHVLGAIILLGTGAGIAFFMVLANRTNDTKTIAHVASTVVIADFIFTASAAIVQPITGSLLALANSWPITHGWVFVSVLLYLFVGVFWLPVVAIQIRLRNLANVAVARNTALPNEYHFWYRIWFASGFPAFFAMLAIVWLMLQKPDINIGF